MWRQTLEAHGLRLSRSKTKYMEYKFSMRQTNYIVKVSWINYTRRWVIDEDVNHRIQSTLDVICDRNVIFKLKGKFYGTTIRHAILYETECWMIKCKQENRLQVAEM
ncbi:hypothetical protein Lal_00000840 [Lupinus albus]|nr:hypothetical protein Lal_00000840 [Lupinus albus]